MRGRRAGSLRSASPLLLTPLSCPRAQEGTGVTGGTGGTGGAGGTGGTAEMQDMETCDADAEDNMGDYFENVVHQDLERSTNMFRNI